MCHPTQSIREYTNGIVASFCFRQGSTEIHGYHIPVVQWDISKLGETIRSLIPTLTLLTDVTGGDIAVDQVSHSWPIEVSFQVMIDFIRPQVSS